MKKRRINRLALREIRERSGVSQKQLADGIGSSAGYIHDIEKGRRNPSLETVRRIADVLVVPFPALMSEPDVWTRDAIGTWRRRRVAS